MCLLHLSGKYLSFALLARYGLNQSCLVYPPKLVFWFWENFARRLARLHNYSNITICTFFFSYVFDTQPSPSYRKVVQGKLQGNSIQVTAQLLPSNLKHFVTSHARNYGQNIHQRQALFMNVWIRNENKNGSVMRKPFLSKIRDQCRSSSSQTYGVVKLLQLKSVLRLNPILPRYNVYNDSHFT